MRIATLVSLVGLALNAACAEQRSTGINRRLQAGDPGAGFSHPYILLLPEVLRANSAILVALPTPQTSTNTSDFLAAAERIAQNTQSFIEVIQVPILVPVLPRPPVRVGESSYINLYIPALSREAMVTTNATLQRMDLQVLAMVDHARREIAEGRGVHCREEAIFAGFSAAGHFASRMAVLHPHRVLAAWIGGVGGHPILPEGAHAGHELTYPLGVADVEEIAGTKFQAKRFRDVRLRFVQGELDTNSSLPETAAPSDSYRFEQAETARAVLGNDPLSRFRKTEAIYAAWGSKAEFRVYPGVGHQMTPDIVRDLIAFIEASL